MQLLHPQGFSGQSCWIRSRSHDYTRFQPKKYHVNVPPVLLPVAAVAAGLVSFVSPCALPLVPAYLSYVSGLSLSDLEAARARRATLQAALLFVAGFTVVFTLLGVSSGLVGDALSSHMSLVLRIAGIGIIILGLASMGLVRIPWISRERRFDLARIPNGPRTAPLVGAAFAFGWTPCVGPVLATILGLAAASKSAPWGGALLVLYSLGLGVPFVLIAIGFQKAKGALRWLSAHGRAIEIVGGMALVLIGAAFVTGAWSSMFAPLQSYMVRSGWPVL